MYLSTKLHNISHSYENTCIFRPSSSSSPLVPYLINKKSKLPRGYINHLVTSAGQDQQTVSEVFKPVLLGMMQEMRTATLVDDHYKSILMVSYYTIYSQIFSSLIYSSTDNLFLLHCIGFLWYPRDRERLG